MIKYVQERGFIMKFFTSDKEPNLRGLLVLLAITVILEIAVLSYYGSESFFIVGYLMELFMIGAAGILYYSAVRQIAYNPYSYKTIYYIGFGVYLTVAAIVNVFILLNFIREPETLNLLNIVSSISMVTTRFSYYSFPFSAIFSILLIISNIQLIKKEGYRLVNILGIILAFCLIGGFFFLWAIDYYHSGSIYEVFTAELICNVFYAIYTYVLCMMIGTIITNMIVSNRMPEPDKGFIMILGCSINADGTPTPLLRTRIDKAIEFAQYQQGKTGKLVNFITSGGQGDDEVVSESQAIKNYLMSKGIAEERIFMENRSTTTAENMRYSKEIIDSIDPNEKAAFATNNYHVLRSGMLAVENGLKAEGAGAKTKWYFWPNAAVREFVGLLASHKIQQALQILLLIIIYAAFTWYRYFGDYLYILRP